MTTPVTSSSTTAASVSSTTEVAGSFGLLESNNIKAVEEIKVLIQGQLSSNKEAWLVNSLVDYYYVSHSDQALEILTEIREPHDKHLIEKISEGIKSVEYRLLAFRLLLHIACKQPIWIQKLVSQPIFPAIVKCLKSETDVPIMMTGVMVLTILLPSTPVSLGHHLQELFDTFSNLVAFNLKKPGNVPEVFLIHLQVALYAFFHRLYGMFPYNFLIFLRHFYSKKENLAAYEEFIKPMLERVRLHHHLIDASREYEISQRRWKHMENHDIIVDCAKMSLDLLEGTWEELTCPISPRVKHQCTVTDRIRHLSGEKGGLDMSQTVVDEELSVYTQPIAGESNMLWSPSHLVGLSTPPPSQRTTPAASLLENSTSQQLFVGMSSTPQVTPPIRTPTETPPITDDNESKGKKSSKPSSTQKTADSRKLSTSSHGEKLHINILPLQQDSGTRSVPPSPLKFSFTSEPPRGTFKSHPVKSAVRELQFDFPNTTVDSKVQSPVKVKREAQKAPDWEVKSTANEAVAPDGEVKSTASEVVAPDGEVKSTASEVVPPSGELKRTASRVVAPDGEVKRTANEVGAPDGEVKRTASEVGAPDLSYISAESRKISLSCTSGTDHQGHEEVVAMETSSLTSNEKEELMESFSMDALPKVIDKLNSDDEETTDKEVSDLTQADQPVYLTAESVQKFMRSVNRIRFNSMTASNDVNTYLKNDKGFNGQGRSRSCPQLPKVTPEEDDDETEQVSRSASKPDFSYKAQDDLSSESGGKSEPPHDEKTEITEASRGVPSDVGGRSSTELNPALCPVLRSKDVQNKEEGIEEKVGLLDLLRHFLMPANISVCQHCKSQIPESDEKGMSGKEAAMFSNPSPPELLDRYFRLGSEVHAKELSKIPITSQESINWTHFGGMPPPDEINILRGQLFMMENQILYERNKREMHAKRNRRLLRRIANANALEEQNKAQTDQLVIQGNEIKNLQVSVKLLQVENKSLKDMQESNEHETRVKLSACLNEKEDLKSAKTELNTLLVRQREEQDKLQQKLQVTEATLFEREKEIVFLKQEVETTQKLKEQVLQLHQELLLMGELQQKYQEKLNVMKLGNQVRPEHEFLLSTLKEENKGMKSQLDVYKVDLHARQSRVAELEESVKQKEFAIHDLKMKLDHVKVSHEDELKAVEDKYNAMVNIYTQLQGQMLKLYSKLDEMEAPKTARVPRHPRDTIKQEENTRDRSGSDPHLTAVIKRPVTQVSSLPLSFHHIDLDHRDSPPTRVTTSHNEGQGHQDHDGFTVISNSPLLPRQQVDDTTSNASRESGLFPSHTSRSSTMSYTEGEDRSSSSKGSHLGDSGYLG